MKIKCCPHCQSGDIKYFPKQQCWHCNNVDCGESFDEPQVKNSSGGSQQVFLSYGHDSNLSLIESIREALESHGHEVWIDKDEIKFTDDWRETITKAIMESDSMLSCLSRHSARDPGVCLDEIGIALAHKQGSILTILVEPERDISPPPFVSSKQWLDLSVWRQYWDDASKRWHDNGAWFNGNMDQIIDAIEMKKQFAGELKDLQEQLKPLPLSSKIATLLGNPFVGRQWLLELIEDWRINQPKQRILWLTAEAGMGKSAVMARLSYLAKGTVLGVHFCEYDQASTGQVDALIRSLSFQLAARLPDYRILLLNALHKLEKPLGELTTDEMFERLLLNPLNCTIDGGQENFLLLIDALDEADPELPNMLARLAERLPRQISLIVSSRPEPSLLGKLAHFPRTELKMDDVRNQQDLAEYIKQWLDRKELEGFRFENRLATQDMLLERSAGNMLYLVYAEAATEMDAFDLNAPAELPQGLSALYSLWFTRQMGAHPQGSPVWPEVYKLLELVTASPQPVPQYLVTKWLGWKGQDKNNVTRPLASLLRRNNETYALCHRSLADWLHDEIADTFWVNPETARLSLFHYLWPELPGALRVPGCSYVEWALAELLPRISLNDQQALVQQDKNELWESCLYPLGEKIERVHTQEARRIQDLYQDSCITWLTNILGAEHFSTLMSISKKSQTLYNTGRNAEVENIYMQLLNIFKPPEINYFTIHILLANVYTDTGREKNAENIFKMVLEVLEVKFPDKKDLIAMCLNGLGVLLAKSERYKESEVYLRRALAVREEILPAGDPAIATCLDGLCALFTKPGYDNHEEAKILCQRALEIREAALAPGDPDIARSLNSMGVILLLTNKAEVAEIYFRKALAIRKSTLPAGHKDIVSTEKNLERCVEVKQRISMSANEKKIGRNGPCPCGSGRKFKHCCIAQ